MNAAAPVAGMEMWKREAIQKIVAFEVLGQDWDAQGSAAPSRAVRQAAIELLLSLPSNSIATPRIVPVSGGGLHFEWAMGIRELEISIDSDCNVGALAIEDGLPLDNEPQEDFGSMFAWLASR